MNFPFHLKKTRYESGSIQQARSLYDRRPIFIYY